MLHCVDQLSVKGMPLTRPAVAEEATNRQEYIVAVIGIPVH